MSNQSKEHENKIFERVNFQEKQLLERSFTKCQFKNCSFYNSDLVDCSFDHCSFDHCDLSLIKVKDCAFFNVTIKGCKAIGILWFDTSNPFSVYFFDSVINYSSFFSKKIVKGKFVNCVAHDVDFSECNLSSADFEGADLQNARFLNCNLSHVNFKNAKNYFIDTNANIIKKAIFSLPEALSLLQNLDIIIE